MQFREVIPFPQKVKLSLTLPGSKSITNRALLCAALARGKSRIFGAGTGEDTRVMIQALRKLGIRMTEKKSWIEVTGTGGKFKKGNLTLALGNAGTTTRFLAAASLLRSGTTVITGDARMRERPIADLVEGLKGLGATVKYLGKACCPPIRIKGLGLPATPHEEVSIRIKGNQSSQYFSALLLVGPCLGRPLKIQISGPLVSRPYIDTTLAVMRSFGVRVTHKAYREFRIASRAYTPRDYRVEGDASAGTYFSSINFLHGGTLRFENLSLKSIQGDIDYPKVLARLGKGSIDMGSMPDAAMTLACTAPFVKSRTTITGVGNLRIKETDRLKALQAELKKIGVRVKTTQNSIAIISPLSFPRRWESMDSRLLGNDTRIQTYNDHRMAMGFAVMGTRIPGITIENPDCVAKSYPGFWDDLEQAYLAPLKLGRRHLVLTGMRGAGKTYLGRKIARHLGRPFIDTDREIERDQGMSIREIVRRHGWIYFREVEQKICSSIRLRSPKATSAQDDKFSQPLVIATGGGVVLSPTNMKHLQHHALTVFIFADPAVLTERVLKGVNRPPLRRGQKPEDEIRHLWQERCPLYLQYADVVWDNTSGQVIENHLTELFYIDIIST